MSMRIPPTLKSCIRPAFQTGLSPPAEVRYCMFNRTAYRWSLRLLFPLKGDGACGDVRAKTEVMT